MIKRLSTSLVDGNGNKLDRAIRKDSHGLYVINKGMRGALVKSFKRYEIDGVVSIAKTYSVDYYEALK